MTVSQGIVTLPSITNLSWYMILFFPSYYIQEIYSKNIVWRLLGVLTALLIIPVTVKLKLYDEAR
jgi:arginine exporter protein ArgO